MQTTVNAPVAFTGIGVHSGAPATATVRPARAGLGYVFRRVDLDEAVGRIPARYDAVTETALCTVVANAAGSRVSTIEHLMAALAGCGVDNAIIDIDGPETPIMDGSAAEFVDGLTDVGLRTLSHPLRALRVLETVRVEHNGCVAQLSPCDRFELGFEIDFPDKAIGRQALDVAMVGDVFAADFAEARTFGRLFEVEALRARGFARGGSLENAVVVDGDSVLNPGGLRRPDEFVRHKILDAVGDLALAGAPIIGRYWGVKAGHDMTNRLLRALFANPKAYRFEMVARREGVLPTPLAMSAPRLAYA